MIELLQRVVNFGWRRSGAVLREVPIAGCRVWYAEFKPLERDLEAVREAARRSGQVRDGGRVIPRTVILFHGLGASSMSFHAVIPQLRRAYRVLVPDLPGYGHSRLPRGRDFLGFRELVDVAERFVARTAPRGAYLAGNSMGGWIAARVAARRPELVHAMALLNPGGPALRAEDWVDFARVIMAEERGATREWLRRLFHRPPLGMRLLLRDFRRIMRAPTVTQLLATLRDDDFLSDEEIERVRCPAVLVWGEQDRLIPDGCRSFYLRHLKGVRYAPVPDCGHCPQLECPDRTAEILLELPALAAQRAAGATGGSKAASRGSAVAAARALVGATAAREGRVMAVARAPKS